MREARRRHTGEKLSPRFATHDPLTRFGKTLPVRDVG